MESPASRHTFYSELGSKPRVAGQREGGSWEASKEEEDNARDDGKEDEKLPDTNNNGYAI